MPQTSPAPGKKWAKVTRTETTMDDKGYMVTKDVDSWEEVDDVKPVRKAAPQVNAAVKKAPAPQKQGKQVQSGLASFFGKK